MEISGSWLRTAWYETGFGFPRFYIRGVVTMTVAVQKQNPCTSWQFLSTNITYLTNISTWAAVWPAITCTKQPIAWLNEHWPVITAVDNMSPSLCSSDLLAASPNSSLKPLTRWLRCNDHWRGSFCLIDTAWTLWHVSTAVHSPNSNDCCCGSLSQLMTSATDWGKCLSLPLTLLRLSVRQLAKQRRSRPGAPAVLKAFIYSFIRTWRKSDARHPALQPGVHQSDIDADPPPSSFPPAISHNGEAGSQPLGPNDTPGNRWREGDMMVVHLPLSVLHAHTQTANL